MSLLAIFWNNTLFICVMVSSFVIVLSPIFLNRLKHTSADLNTSLSTLPHLLTSSSLASVRCRLWVGTGSIILHSLSLERCGFRRDSVPSLSWSAFLSHYPFCPGSPLLQLHWMFISCLDIWLIRSIPFASHQVCTVLWFSSPGLPALLLSLLHIIRYFIVHVLNASSNFCSFLFVRA